MKAVTNFKQMHNVGRISTTLFEIVARDAANNPDLYNETPIIEEMTALHHFLVELQNHEFAD